MNFLWIVCSILLLHEHTFGHELPYDFSEGCPKDSILTNGICKCDHSLCDKPPCMYTLKLLIETTDTPGNCCPKYSCEGCKKHEQLDGQCPCAPEAVIESGRKCKCVDRYRKLINNTCVCDTGKCELPDLCDERSVPVREMDGCCEKIKCIPCPDDSYVNSYNEFVIEDKCVCFPCPATKCNETHTPQILRRGRNTPGTCCDIYKCVSIDPNMGCIVNKTVYSVGETWTSGGDICVCQQNGITYCSHLNPTSESHGFRPCLAGGKVYNHMDTWILEDGCTNCTCHDGKPKCIAHMCDIDTSEMRKSTSVCPPLAKCHTTCSKGYKVNHLGCDMCECNDGEDADVSRAEYYQFRELMKEHNLTINAIIDLIKSLGQGGSLTDVTSGIVTSIPTVATASSPSTTSTTTKSTVIPLLNICTDKNHTLGDCAYSCLLEYALPAFVIGTILGTILVLTFRKCVEKNRQKYTMYMPVGKDTPVDKNLNLSTIIKQNTKNFELQSYNEKKNAI